VLQQSTTTCVAALLLQQQTSTPTTSTVTTTTNNNDNNNDNDNNNNQPQQHNKQPPREEPQEQDRGQAAIVEASPAQAELLQIVARPQPPQHQHLDAGDLRVALTQELETSAELRRQLTTMRKQRDYSAAKCSRLSLELLASRNDHIAFLGKISWRPGKRNITIFGGLP
jgi:hypothetical protein